MEGDVQSSHGFLPWIFRRKLIAGGRGSKKGALTIAFLFAIVALIGIIIVFQLIRRSILSGSSWQRAFSFPTSQSPVMQPKRIEYFLNCSGRQDHKSCPVNHPIKTAYRADAGKCPEYFRWIYEDLRPWKESGITREMVENAKREAHFRLVVVNGKVYIDKYRPAYQTRDVFTIWGILQLLRLYPGRLPDLDLMFQCNDRPSILKSKYEGEHATPPPPLFHYCGNNSTLDIVFPDWSFWGWVEINIPPWETLKKELERGNHLIKWKDRKPYAYWKGNIFVGNPMRRDLAKCNVTDNQDWNARIYHLSWPRESQKGFKNTRLAKQCDYRYKIYAEGNAWSVSEKYILACDSMSLFIRPQYFDFFTRDLLPTVHYWPVNKHHLCQSLKFVVDWGNKHPEKAQRIGKAGSRYIQEKLKMKYIYDYMFHLLNEYGKLLKYKPTVPEGITPMCLERMACRAKRVQRKFQVESMVKAPAEIGSCSLPLPYRRPELEAFLERKERLRKQVEMWEASADI
ncbi:uncharacterized protein LOC127787653 [Diospyros lotus]|uniref:uncharacterized protein LOC127787653 n=1 Tax=Diospyros lotus TaxID=55363 RepID=UPI002253ECE5|nr:uncharacterized protein LOC127787653 [Diospyros lotus]